MRLYVGPRWRNVQLFEYVDFSIGPWAVQKTHGEAVCLTDLSGACVHTAVNTHGKAVCGS